jgi:lipopolysaccharide export system permease protein
MLRLNDGYMLSVPTKTRGELDRLYFDVDHIRVANVASQFQQTSSDSSMKGDREMTVCEMQEEYDRASTHYDRAMADYAEAVWRSKGAKGAAPPPAAPRHAGGIGASYCNLTKFIAASISRLLPPAAGAQTFGHSRAAHEDSIQESGAEPDINVEIQQTEVDRTRERRNSYGVEIQKKFSLAASCIVLALVGAPLALRFPRGGVGLVIGVSFGIFALYYIGLIGGESLSDKGYVTPFWAMWTANIIFFAVGMVLYARMGHEASSARGGDMREWLDSLGRRLRRRPPADEPAKL